MERKTRADIAPHGNGEVHTPGHVTEGAGNHHSHACHTSHESSSEVEVTVMIDRNTITLYLKDKAGNPVDELEVNHEKLLHFMIMDENIHNYYHVHPEKTGKGEFAIPIDLPEGYYRAFVDITPKHLSYQVEAIPFKVGNPTTPTHRHGLMPDSSLSKSVDGKEIKLTVSSFKAHEPVKLSFELDHASLTPYLGVMGHVVIVDEEGRKFLHVHPSSYDELVFETSFDKAGVYKIWAEFKQDKKVRAFPFVVEIKE